MVDRIEINEKEYFKLYKDIMRTCIKEGDVLPSHLAVIDVPVEYDLSDDEIGKVKLSKDMSSSMMDRMLEYEEKLAGIRYESWEQLNSDLNTVDNEQLMGFIGRHPEFQKILK